MTRGRTADGGTTEERENAFGKKKKEPIDVEGEEGEGRRGRVIQSEVNKCRVSCAAGS